MTVDGKRLRQLAKAPLLTQSTWSPDGKQIAFVTWDRMGKPNVKKKHERILVDVQKLENPNVIKKHPVFMDLEDPVGGQRNIYVINTDGQNLRQLIQDDPIKPAPAEKRISWTGYPSWSVDGDWIAYSASDERVSRHSHIYVINAVGAGRIESFQVTAHPSSNLNPTWVPETFFPVSPTEEKKITLWGRLKQY